MVGHTFYFFLSEPFNELPRASRGCEQEGSASGAFNIFNPELRAALECSFDIMPDNIENSALLPRTVMHLCSSFSAKAFFADSPWLNVPRHRRGEILIEPLYPRGGLLGGTSAAPPGKMSKLAKLAASRKKKASVEKENAGSVPQGQASSESSEQAGIKPTTQKLENPYTKRVQSSQAPPKKESSQRFDEMLSGQRSASLEKPEAPISEPPKLESVPTNLHTQPSTFARAMLGNYPRPPEAVHQPHLSFDLSVVIGRDLLKPNAFAGPSPDDIVATAQNAPKGTNHSGFPSTSRG